MTPTSDNNDYDMLLSWLVDVLILFIKLLEIINSNRTYYYIHIEMLYSNQR